MAGFVGGHMTEKGNGGARQVHVVRCRNGRMHWPIWLVHNYGWWWHHLDTGLPSCWIRGLRHQECNQAGTFCLHGFSYLCQDHSPTASYQTERYHQPSGTFQVWSNGLDISPLPTKKNSRQKAWDAPWVAVSFKTLHEVAKATSFQGWLLAASRKDAATWLQTLLVSSLGLRIEDNVFSVATEQILGVPLCQPHKYQLCSKRTHGAYIVVRVWDAIHIRPNTAAVLSWRNGRSLT